MNIFVLDSSPYFAARQLCNAHVIKMPTESSNMLLWPFKLMGLDLPKTKSGETVKLSHLNHPSSIWVRESFANYQWALNNLSEMLEEYKKRYKRNHFSETYRNFIYENQDKIKFTQFSITPVARCFGPLKEKLETIENSVEAYREFYKLGKPFARWPSLQNIPDWWHQKTLDFVDKNFNNGDYTKRKALV
jgi:hypothetical protein